jgi:hypothetical protein
MLVIAAVPRPKPRQARRLVRQAARGRGLPPLPPVADSYSELELEARTYPRCGPAAPRLHPTPDAPILPPLPSAAQQCSAAANALVSSGGSSRLPAACPPRPGVARRGPAQRLTTLCATNTFPQQAALAPSPVPATPRRLPGDSHALPRPAGRRAARCSGTPLRGRRCAACHSGRRADTPAEGHADVHRCLPRCLQRRQGRCHRCAARWPPCCCSFFRCCPA